MVTRYRVKSRDLCSRIDWDSWRHPQISCNVGVRVDTPPAPVIGELRYLGLYGSSDPGRMES